MIHVIHPSGNTFVRALLAGLETSGSEFRYWTTIAMQSERLWSIMPKNVRSQLERRSYPIPQKFIRKRPMREWVRLLSPRAGLGFLVRHEVGWASVDKVYQDLDAAVARGLPGEIRLSPGADWVYGYEDGSLASFRVAEQIGMRRAYELPIAYWETSRRLLDEEAQRLPEWAGTLIGPADSEAKLQRKSEELKLADVVVVPSKFVERTLPVSVRSAKKVVVAEFGSPNLPHAELNTRKDQTVDNRKLRLLFAGSMSQRKGLADVFAAMRLIARRDVELIVLGSPVVPMEFYRKQGVSFTFEPPRCHTQVLQLMRTCDLLVLPSIVEGRALVQQEALACGLPIVVTANAGGEDLVDDGVTGFLVPIRSPESIAASINSLADNRNQLNSMRHACRAKAAEYSWDRYVQCILDSLKMQNSTPAN